MKNKSMKKRTAACTGIMLLSALVMGSIPVCAETSDLDINTAVDEAETYAEELLTEITYEEDAAEAADGISLLTTNAFTIMLQNDEAILTALAAPEGVSRVTASREGLADVQISLAPSDIYGDLSWADLTKEQQETIGAAVTEDFAEATVEEKTTASGNAYLSVRSNEASDISMIFTLYRGYFVELDQYRSDFSTLSQEDLDFALELLQNITFVDYE